MWSRPCRVPQCRRDQVKGQAARRHDVLLPCWPTTGKLKNSENKINTYSLQEQAELPEPNGQLLQHRHHQGLWLIRWKLSIKKLSFIRYSFPVVRWEREKHLFVEAGRRRLWLLSKNGQLWKDGEWSDLWMGRKKNFKRSGRFRRKVHSWGQCI